MPVVAPAGATAATEAATEILVGFRPGATRDSKDLVHRALGGTLIESIDAIDVDVVRATADLSLAYGASPVIDFVETNARGTLAALAPPDDAALTLPTRWRLDRTATREAWANYPRKYLRASEFPRNRVKVAWT